MTTLRTDEVFGVSNRILSSSYVDRGDLDSDVSRHLSRSTHIAIKGVSKAGKTWLRQSVVPNALVIQCRLGKKIVDIYREALAELGVSLEVTKEGSVGFTGSVEGETEVGVGLIGKVKAKIGIGISATQTITTNPTRHPIEDLRFVAELVIESGRRLVIEDFHYLSHAERRSFAFDLKALWDFGLFVVIVGVWSESNLFLSLNHDLTGRVREESIVWSEVDLLKILDKGGKALNVRFDESVSRQLISDSYGNSGILQRLTLEALDRAGIQQKEDNLQTIDETRYATDAALFYAEELNTVYQAFAQKVAGGIRTYANSTGIYGHAMAVVFDGTDDELLLGIHIDTIYRISHGRQSRIQKGNLRAVLEKFESLQVDEDGRGLVLSYADEKVRVVDRQLLLYRRYSTVRWPWDSLIAQADQREDGYDTAGS